MKCYLCDRNGPFENGGEKGIRTLGTVSRTHAFQACSFNHSDISPFRISDLRVARHQIIARRLRLPSVSRSYYDSASYERACAPRRSNCVGPLNLVRSLTALPLD